MDIGVGGGELRYGILRDVYETVKEFLQGLPIQGAIPDLPSSPEGSFQETISQEVIGQTDEDRQDFRMTHFSDGLVAVLTGFEGEEPEPIPTPIEGTGWQFGQGGGAGQAGTV